MSSLYYAGVGSRKINASMFYKMQGISRDLYSLGYTLRSGGAEGSDRAFESGLEEPTNIQSMCKEIYLPWKRFNGNKSVLYPKNLDKWKEAEFIAEQHHPRWKDLSYQSRAFHTRNVFQVLGKDLKTPSKFIMCYTENGSGKGGTGQAIRVARTFGIEVFDLGSGPLIEHFGMTYAHDVARKHYNT